jgi:hypothetical protein
MESSAIYSQTIVPDDRFTQPKLEDEDEGEIKSKSSMTEEGGRGPHPNSFAIDAYLHLQYYLDGTVRTLVMLWSCAGAPTSFSIRHSVSSMIIV